MPKGPKGVKPTADVLGDTMKVMEIATGEIAVSSSQARS
jgi:hypothetical protein